MVSRTLQLARTCVAWILASFKHELDRPNNSCQVCVLDMKDQSKVHVAGCIASISKLSLPDSLTHSFIDPLNV